MMHSFKIAALCFGLAAGFVAIPAYAETAAAPSSPKSDAPEPPKAEAPTTMAPSTEAAKPEVKAPSKSTVSEADKRAKAIDCSKQADAKKLHGEERKKFRSDCKREK